jgi:LacI family transcriptional regulator
VTTLKEVAKKAGVSVGTVSNVITGAVAVSSTLRERVLVAISELGYQPNHVARSLKLRRTKMLGMVISDITNPFFSQMVRGAEDAALKRKYLLLTCNTDDRAEREEEVVAVLRSQRVDGILLVVTSEQKRPSHILETIKGGTPVVCLDRLPPGVSVDSVTVDNTAAARDCVRHLLKLGHRRVGIITGSLSLQTASERLQGYQEALAEAGIDARPEWILHGNFRAESGYCLGRELLSSLDRPTALFISNSLMAIGVLRALADLGLHCPEDVALATFDELPLMEVFRPHLTAVAQPAYSFGYSGAELLIQRVESKTHPARPPIAIRLPTELKVRESTLGYRFLPRQN